METAKIILISLCFAVAAAGCAPTRVAAPPAKQPRVYGSQQQITERPLDTGSQNLETKQNQSRPQPIKLPYFEEKPVDADAAAEPELLLPVGYVNDRIFEYGRKLERWKQLDEQSVVMNLSEEQTETMVRCFRDLQKVLNSYGRLHDDLLQRNIIAKSEMFSTEEVLELQRMDIAFLDSECAAMLGGGKEDKSAGWQERQEDADLNQIETLIERYSNSKEYDEVVQVWLKIPSYQVERVDLKTKILYGNALMYLDQQEKASDIYQQIVDEMSVSEEQPTDLLSLRKVLADLYTASGNYLAAESQYDQISSDYLNIGRIEEWSKLQLSILERSSKGSPELTEFSRLLRQYLGFLPERDGYEIVWQADKFLQNYPYSPVTSNVDIIKEDALKRADNWFNSFFSRVDAFAEEKKFQDAMELLQTIPEDIIGQDKIQEVKVKTDELVLAEAVERETVKIEKMQELQRRWNEGMTMADSGDFDGAITVFTELLETEYASKAEVRIEELSLQAAKADRKKAAELFIRFTKTADLESRKRLLVESRKILKNILVKYPEVEIAQRVLGNIDRVEKEMNELDPMLLPKIEEEERRQQAAQGTEKEEIPVGLDAFDLPAIQLDNEPGVQPVPNSEPGIVPDQETPQIDSSSALPLQQSPGMLPILTTKDM